MKRVGDPGPDIGLTMRRVEVVWGPVVALLVVAAGVAGRGWALVPAGLVVAAWVWYSPLCRAWVSTSASVYPDREVGRCVRRLLLRGARVAEALGMEGTAVRPVRHQPIRLGAEVDLVVRGAAVSRESEIATVAARVVDSPLSWGAPTCEYMGGDVFRVSFSTFGYRPSA